MFRLKRVKFDSGERYSLLIDNDGIPLWYPTLFATSQLRNAAKAPNTIEAHLNAIKLLFEWTNSNRIDLRQSFLTLKFLTVEQIESLCDYLKQDKSQIIKNDVISEGRRQFPLPTTAPGFQSVCFLPCRPLSLSSLPQLREEGLLFLYT